MEAREIVGVVAAVAVIGVVTYAIIKQADRDDQYLRNRTGANLPKPDPFWDNAAERNRINRIASQMARETDPEVRRELARQMGDARSRLAA